MENPIELPDLPLDIWSQQILSRVSLRDARHLGQTYKHGRVAFKHHLNRQMRFDLHKVATLIKLGHEAGIKVDENLIHHLYHNPFTTRYFFDILTDMKKEKAALAAVCGDIEWLISNDLLNLKFTYEKSILYYFVCGGHSETIADNEALMTQLRACNDKTFFKLYQAAGRLGHFNVCDLLETIKPITDEQVIIDDETKLHYFTLHGKLKKLEPCIYNDDLKYLKPTHSMGHLVHYAIAGGHAHVLIYLMVEYPEHIQANVQVEETNALIIAAQYGHSDIVRRLLHEYNVDPCKTTKLGNTALRATGYRGSWDCLLLLYPHFTQQDNFESTLFAALGLAVENSHIDFVHRVITHFGVHLVQGKSPDGKRLAHYLFDCQNLLTVRHMMNRYPIDLLAKNDSGDHGLLAIAKFAQKYKNTEKWPFIADVVNEYESTYGDRLLNEPGADGISLKQIITDPNNDRSELFNCLRSDPQQLL